MTLHFVVGVLPVWRWGIVAIKGWTSGGIPIMSKLWKWHQSIISFSLVRMRGRTEWLTLLLLKSLRAIGLKVQISLACNFVNTGIQIVVKLVPASIGHWDNSYICWNLNWFCQNSNNPCNYLDWVLQLLHNAAVHLSGLTYGRNLQCVWMASFKTARKSSLNKLFNFEMDLYIGFCNRPLEFLSRTVGTCW